MGERATQESMWSSNGRDVWFTLLTLMAVSIFINADRSLMSILMESIKADFGISDAEVGFIFGTSISVFYALFSIPLGRLADVWNRKTLTAVGIGACGVMIAVTGAAKSFMALAVCRIGVGIGESSAGPAAISMVADLFPARWRATAMSIMASGANVGTGIGLFAGGYTLDAWNNAYPDSESAPFGLKGWQASIMLLALFGVFLSWVVSSLKEPKRGASDGLDVPPYPHPFRDTWEVMKTILPGFNLAALGRLNGVRGVFINLLLALGLTFLVLVLSKLTESAAQWVALLFGVYCVASWIQAISFRDTAMYTMIFKSRTLVLIFVGAAFFFFVNAGVLTWIAPLLQRVYSVSASQAGLSIGLCSVAGGLIGTVLGGVIADRLRGLSQVSGFYVMMGSIVLTGLALMFLLEASSYGLAILGFAIYVLFSSLWFGVVLSLVSELLVPRMRATATAFYLISITFTGFALGPYTVGLLSDLFQFSGSDAGEALSSALKITLVALPFGLVLIFLASRNFARESSSVVERARALGEEVNKA